MNKKTLEAIQCLIGLAKFGSISVAAKELSLEHKTLKNKVLFLEKEINKKLINSSSLGTFLTEDGWALYRMMSNDFDNLVKKYHAYLGNDIATGNNPVIDLLFPPVMTLFFSIHILPKIYKLHPELEIRITTLSASYILSHGSHIKNIANAYNILGAQESILKLINQDEWHLGMSFDEKMKLCAHKDYIVESNINSFNDIRNTNFIVRHFSNEELGSLKFYNNKLNCEENINYIQSTIVENDFVKCHLVNQKIGIGLLSETVLNCAQDLDIVELFPEYVYKNTNKYALIYKQNEIDSKYTKSIISITKDVFNQKLNS